MQWHFEPASLTHTSPSVEHESLLFKQIKNELDRQDTDPWKPVSTAANLQQLSWIKYCRHFVGYCENAIVQLGTREARYDNMDYTALERPKVIAPSLRSVTVGVGYQGFINVEGEFEMPHQHLVHAGRRHSVTFADLLFWAEQHPILLYEETLHKAYLIPLITVLVHMLLKWAQVNRCDQDLPHPPSSAAGLDNNASYRYLLHNQYHILSRAQMPTNASTGSVGVQLQDLVMRLYIDMQACLREPLAQRSVLTFFQRRAVYGWELMDIIEGNLELRRKQDIIRHASPCWTSLTTTTSCFVVRGLGDIITPAVPTSLCNTWNQRLASQQYVLVASTWCIRLLARREGVPMRLTADNYWMLVGDQNALFAPCTHQNATCKKHIQVIDKKKPDTVAIRLPPNGAVVFR